MFRLSLLVSWYVPFRPPDICCIRLRSELPEGLVLSNLDRFRPMFNGSVSFRLRSARPVATLAPQLQLRPLCVLFETRFADLFRVLPVGRVRLSRPIPIYESERIDWSPPPGSVIAYWLG